MTIIYVGDMIAARRKVPSNIYHNIVVGPVSALYDNACEIITNPGTEIEGNWRIPYSDWTIQVLKKACEEKP